MLLFRSPQPFLFFPFQGAGHNDVELYNQYLERLRHFVNTEISNWHQAQAAAPASSTSTEPTAAANASTSSNNAGENSKGETQIFIAQKLSVGGWVRSKMLTLSMG